MSALVNRTSTHVFRICLATLIGVALLSTGSVAQTVIDAPIKIPLVKTTIGTGSSSYEKLGIYASIGGGTPGLFEFDTGGTGFFAVISSGQANPTPWWGPNVVSNGTPFVQPYTSGFDYTGQIVKAPVSLYGSATDTTPVIVSGADTLVGRTDSIANSKTKKTLWPPPASLPPVDQTYFGDFGLNLSGNPNAPGVVNILEQLSYTNGVIGGFIVHAGAHNDKSSPYLQVGLTQQELASFPILFKIQPQGHGTVPVSGLPYYPLQVFSGILKLYDSAQKQQFSQSLVGVTLDTGNQTPVIFNAGNVVPQVFLSQQGQSTILLPGSYVSLVGSSQAGSFDIFDKLQTGTIEGVNKVDVATPKSNILSFNVGLPIFEQYDIVFDFKDGLVGFRPVGPVQIPLKVVNIGTPKAPEYKLGIYVGLGGGAPKLYEFDTGAAGFFAAYKDTETPWWTKESWVSTKNRFLMSYSSGITYQGEVVATQVSIYASDAPGAVPVASVSADVGKIDRATGKKVKHWDEDLSSGTPPLYTHFYGDFGVALYQNACAPKKPLHAILPQLGSRKTTLGRGFSLTMGDYANPAPVLQIGLTDDDVTQYPQAFTMNPASGTQAGTFPVGGSSTFAQDLLSGAMILDAGYADQSTQSLNMVLDTGAPSTEIHTVPGGITMPNDIRNLQLTATDTSPQTETVLQYQTGPLKGKNAANPTTKVNPSFPTGYINSGLNFFFQNDVMFDLDGGEMGLLPVALTQTISFPPISGKAYGDAPFPTKATASSSLPLTYIWSGPISISGNTVTLTGAGNARIRTSQAGSSHYLKAADVVTTFTIAKAPQQITFPVAPDQTVGGIYALNATASSNLAVRYTLVSGPAKLSSSGVLTFTGAGAVTVQASQSGNVDYNPAAPVTQSIVVK